MKNISIILVAAAAFLVLALATPAFAADASKARTITGEAKCAKCMLKETDKCQTVIQVENKKGKTINYYLVSNDVSKAFHQNVCKEAKKVTATGTVKRVDGKREFTASKIELAN
jgi:Family of unknown function (DUF6370)